MILGAVIRTLRPHQAIAGKGDNRPYYFDRPEGKRTLTRLLLHGMQPPRDFEWCRRCMMGFQIRV